MNEKELVRHLSSLSALKPEGEWVKKNREVLSYQIFNGQEYAAPEVSWFTQFSFVMHRVLQPAPIAALIALFFVVSGVVGLKTSGNANPKDNRVLYIAKILNEKVNLATTFDEKGKLALNVDYAQNRVAELEQISQAPETASETQVKELTESFQAEIASARQRLNQLSVNDSKTDSAKPAVEAPKPVAVAKTAPADLHKAGTLSDGDAVISADDLKKDAEVSVPSDAQKPGVSDAAKAATETVQDATSSLDAQKALEEAEQLFNSKDYKGAADKLNQIKIQ